jgi:peptide/nickel transport system permease protein
MKQILLWLDSDLGYSFRTSPSAILAAVIALMCVVCAAFAGWVAPHIPSTSLLFPCRIPDYLPPGKRKEV